MFGPHTRQAAACGQRHRHRRRASRDAGSYLCNYLSWRAIEAVNARQWSPPRRLYSYPATGARRRVRRNGLPRITLEDLVDAGEAMLLEMVRLARGRSCANSVGRAKDACPNARLQRIGAGRHCSAALRASSP